MATQAFGKVYRGNAAENYERFFVPVIGAPLAIDLIGLATLRRNRATPAPPAPGQPHRGEILHLRI